MAYLILFNRGISTLIIFKTKSNTKCEKSEDAKSHLSDKNNTPLCNSMTAIGELQRSSITGVDGVFQRKTSAKPVAVRRGVLSEKRFRFSEIRDIKQRVMAKNQKSISLKLNSASRCDETLCAARVDTAFLRKVRRIARYSHCRLLALVSQTRKVIALPWQHQQSRAIQGD